MYKIGTEHRLELEPTEAFLTIPQITIKEVTLGTNDDQMRLSGTKDA